MADYASNPLMLFIRAFLAHVIHNFILLQLSVSCYLWVIAIAIIRPWYVDFPLMCVGLLSSKIPSIRCLISKSVRYLFTTTKLFHASTFTWGESVLHKQVIV